MVALNDCARAFVEKAACSKNPATPAVLKAHLFPQKQQVRGFPLYGSPKKLGHCEGLQSIRIISLDVDGPVCSHGQRSPATRRRRLHPLVRQIRHEGLFLQLGSTWLCDREPAQRRRVTCRT